MVYMFYVLGDMVYMLYVLGDMVYMVIYVLCIGTRGHGLPVLRDIY